MQVDQLIEKALKKLRPHANVNSSNPLRVFAWYFRVGFAPLIRGIGIFLLARKIKKPVFLGRHTKLLFRSKLEVGRFVQIGDFSYINSYSLNGVEIGDGVTIREFAWIQCSSSPSNPGQGLEIGSNTYIGPRCILGVGGSISIGRDCQIGAGFTAIAENHVAGGTHALEPVQVTRKGIVIGDNTWIGHNVTVLDGVTVGANSVIGAGSVVTKSFGPDSRIAGVPARAI
jgi:acetyltransferase-like isoleucine patch superfamily enzyme